jgi:hypothetical protein
MCELLQSSVILIVTSINPVIKSTIISHVTPDTRDNKNLDHYRYISMLSVHF